ncbi:SIR2 family protein [Candidatus Dependentiae bacterium]|nr:SIR2 family protein [Candidatus Dependentiae bacterium]
MKFVDRESAETFLKLKKEIETKRHRFAAFIGAGTSKFIGMPDWKELLENMNKEFNAKIDLEKKINQKIEFPKIAQEIFNHNPDTDKYLNFMKTQFEFTKTYHYSLHLKILTLFKFIITTNFDLSFIKANNDLLNFAKLCTYGIKYQSVIHCFPNFKITEIDYKIGNILYLHGNINQEAYIFKYDEYYHFYPKYYNNLNGSTSIEMILKIIFKELSLLFFGFSFNDKMFVKYLKYFYKEEDDRDYEKIKKLFNKEIKPIRPNHYVLISENEIKDYFAYEDFSDIDSEKALDDQLISLLFDFKNGKYYFKDNFQHLYKYYVRSPKQIEKIGNLKKQIESNEERRILFSELNINVIKFKRKDYKVIEDIVINIIEDLNYEEELSD